MSAFLAAYGLWILIALLVVIVILFLLSGKKKDAAAQPDLAVPAPVRPDPVIAPEPDPLPMVETISEPATPTPAAIAPPPPVPAPATPASDGADNLLQLKGVGPKLATLLTELGVTRFAQIAAWTDADLAAIDARLGNFKGRPVRDQWIDQAKYLAAGDTAGFEAKYGKL